MTTVLRQENKKFVEALNNLRQGADEGLKYILNNSSPSIIKNALWLCGTNKNAENRNSEEMAKIKGKEYIFKVSISKLSEEIKYKEIDDEVISVAKSKTLKLKVGCKVVALINEYNIKGELLFTNGSRGIVTGIDDENEVIKVEFENGNNCDLMRHSWEIKRYYYDKVKRKLECKIVASFSQIPLVLGYAATVHKSQGQTLNAINVDKDCNFAFGQMYVALSRVKEVGKIYIKNKNFNILCSDEVKKFYNIN